MKPVILILILILSIIQAKQPSDYNNQCPKCISNEYFYCENRCIETYDSINCKPDKLKSDFYGCSEFDRHIDLDC